MPNLHGHRGRRVGRGLDGDANALLRGQRLVDDLVRRVPEKAVADGDQGALDEIVASVEGNRLVVRGPDDARWGVQRLNAEIAKAKA